MQQPKPNEENGSSVTHVVVESSTNKDGREWKLVDEFELSGGEDVIRNDVTLSGDISCFRVKMRNDIGDSDPSPVVDVPPAVFPGIPKNVKCIDVSHDQVKISWQKPDINPEAATRYELEGK